MELNFISELKSAHDTYRRLLEAHTPVIINAAEIYREKIHEAYKGFYGDERKDYHHVWLISDSICINDELGIEFWADGRCGNNDECVDTMPLTDDIFTEAGLQKLADEWVANEKICITSKEQTAAREKQSKIKSLEAELAKLTQD